jgi:flagellar basal body rod protein FlgB
MAMEIFDSTFVNLQESINRTVKQQSVISQNIANINNPSYEAQDFDAVLNKVVKRTNKKVVLEEEMSALSKNAMQHSSYVKLLALKLGVLHTVTTQGKK